jgi:predicted DsbA family dithiol-disulfide isomerase/rhodanese-related sulfurtransferase
VVSALTVTAIFPLAILEVLRPALLSNPAVALGAVRKNLAVCVAAVALGAPAFLWLSRHGELPPIALAPREALDERLVRPDSHTTGNPNAAVTIVEWGDLECPSCGLEQPTIRELRQKYGDRIRFVFRQFPLTGIHPQAEKAAEASECAAEQGRFWEALDKIYAEQNDLSEPALMRDAADLGLDQGRFQQCLESGAAAARVRRDLEDARALHVDRTPTFFVNDRVMTGQIPLEQFTQVIDLELRSRGSFAQVRSRLEKSEKSDARPPTQPSETKAQSGDGQAAADPSSAAGATGLLGQNPADPFSQFQQPGIACSEEEANKRQPTLVRTGEALQLFRDRAKVLFVDVRPTGDFRRGHIRGAVNMPVQEVPQRWSALPKDRTIVFYESGRSAGDVCASGRAAGRVLLEHGFSPENVKAYQDGLAGWEHARLPVER